MKESYFFPHDYHARHDPKLTRLRMEFGVATDGIFWNLVEMLYEEGGYLPITDIPFISKAMNAPEDIVHKVVEVAFQTEGDKFFNKSQLERMSHIQSIRDKNRQAGKISGVQRKRNIRSTPVEHSMNHTEEKREKRIEENNTPLPPTGDVQVFFDYFLERTKRGFKLTKDNSELIKKRFAEGYTLEQLKAAVDNFVADPWEGRIRHLELIYCIGKQRGKPDALERWLNTPKPDPMAKYFKKEG